MNQEIMAINLATVQIHFDAEKAGDWEKIKTMYTDDIIWERACMDQVVEGKEEIVILIASTGSPPRTELLMKAFSLSR
jgi:ketosteroid isomerase-like protein